MSFEIIWFHQEDKDWSKNQDKGNLSAFLTQVQKIQIDVVLPYFNAKPFIIHKLPLNVDDNEINHNQGKSKHQ